MAKKEKSIDDLLGEKTVEMYKNGEIKSLYDLQEILKTALQPLAQKLLDAEMENHLDYPKYGRKKDSDNSRNGYCKEKEVKTEHGTITVKTPRDRNGTFDPIIIEKGQTTLEGFEEKCISLYAKGVSLRDIENILKDLYKVDLNKNQISTLINAVNEQVTKWQNRKLKPIYPFVFADCLYVPIKENYVSQKKAVYVLLGIDNEGYKEVLGIWIDKSESATFWTNVFEDLKQRGVEDILYMTSDGIAGFKGSLESVFNKTQSQRCVVHLVRNIYKLCPRKEANKIIKSFKKIYTSANLEEAKLNLELFKENHSEHKNIIKKVEDFMQYLEPLFELPAEIRKVIYTTNAIESVNSALRKVTNGKGSFPSEEALLKVLFLRIRDLKLKWSKPIKNWKIINQQLIQLFGERYTKYLKI